MEDSNQKTPDVRQNEPNAEQMQEQNAAQNQTESQPIPPTEATANSKRKRVWKIVGTLTFVLVIVAIIVYTAVKDFSGENVDVGRVFQLIGSRWYYLLVLLGLFFITIFMETIKIFFMIRKTTGKYKFGTAFNCAALGKLYDYVTPFGSGGQPFQIYYLAKHGVPGGPAGAIPIGSLFLTQFTFVVCAIVSFCVGVPAEIVPLPIQILAYVGSFFYIVVPLFLVVFSFFPKAGHKVIEWGVRVLAKIKICKNPESWISKGNAAIDNNKKNMAIIFKSKRVLIVGTLLGFVYNIAQCSLPYFALLLFPDALAAYGWTPSWELWFEVTRITFFIYCAVTLIPTPGNSGAADGTFYGLFRTVLVTVAGASFTCMMVWRMFSFYSYLLLGCVVYIFDKIINRRRNLFKQ